MVPAGRLFIWHTAHYGDLAKKREQKALPGIQGSNARGRDWTLL